MLFSRALPLTRGADYSNFRQNKENGQNISLLLYITQCYQYLAER